MYFDQLGLKIGKKYTIAGVEAFTNNVILTKKGNEIVVNREAAQHIYVEKE